MKILLVHTFYQVRGGEDTVFEQEFQMLKDKHETQTLTFSNQGGFKGAIFFFLSLFNFYIYLKVRRSIIAFSPDIIHIHNWHYALGPIVIRISKKLDIPIVSTLHNYRLLCPSGSLMDKGFVFTDSINSNFPWKAVKKKVFRNSYLMTFWLAFTIWFHKKVGTWNFVDKYILLTPFAKQLYSSSTLGVDSSRFCIKPNFVSPSINFNIDRKPFFLYVGRLSEEKGTEVLLSAFQKCNFQLKIVGDGPLAEKVKKADIDFDNIQYLGALDRNSVHKLMSQCTALIFPSIWFEGMPMVILEAFSLGTPVIASNFGAMSSLIQNGANGIHFEVNNSKALVEALTNWRSYSLTVKQSFSYAALETYKLNYTPEANYKMLIEIYHSVINNKFIDNNIECLT